MSSSSISFIQKTISLVSQKFAWLLVIVVALFLSFLIVASGPNAEPLEQAETAWAVSSKSATIDELPPLFLSFGKVESRQIAELKTTIHAPVQEVFVQEGSLVEEGELLVQLDPAETQLAVNVSQANYDQNKALLASVKAQYALSETLLVSHKALTEISDSKMQRATELHHKSMISDAALDEARQEANERRIILQRAVGEYEDFPNKIAQQQAILDESVARLERAQLDLAQTRITAPFAGRIISNNVAKGDRVIASSAIIRIADYANLELRATLPNPTAARLNQSLAQGLKVSASAQLDGQRLNFTLLRLSADVKQGKSGVDAFFAIEHSAGLSIGRTVSLAINLPPEQNVFTMPVHALYENNTLYKIVENRLLAVAYEEVGDYLDSEGNFTVLVRSRYVTPGDKLMTSQLPRAINGLLVESIDNADTAEFSTSL